MASLKVPSGEICPKFMVSIMMGLAGAPRDTFISGADIKGLQSKPEKIREMKLCESLISKGESICSDMSVAGKHETRFMGEFRTSLVYKLFEKGQGVENENLRGACLRVFRESQPGQVVQKSF